MDVIIGAQVQSSAFPQFNFKQTGGGGALAQEWRFQINPDGSYHIYDITGGVASRFVILQNGNIGINNDAPGQRLTVGGVIESTAGGFKFPDGSTQSAAAIPMVNNCANGNVLGWNGSAWVCAPAATGGGGIASVAAGTGILVSGTSNVTVSVDPSQLPLLLNTNTFTGNQTINGDLALTGSIVIGTGSKKMILGGLTAPSGTTAQTALRGGTTPSSNPFGFNILD